MNASILGNILGKLGQAPTTIGQLASGLNPNAFLERRKTKTMRAPRAAQNTQAFEGIVVGTFAKRALAVLCQAATAGGAASPAQQAVMRSMMERFAGRIFSSEEIDRLLNNVVALDSLDEFRSLSLGLSEDQRETLLRASIKVITADDNFTKTECRYLADLYAGFGISTFRFETIVDEALGQTAVAA